ncbi:MAG: hypothetical protein GY915_03345 [bacterium]|nr:hypothetical protein [bacterium]
MKKLLLGSAVALTFGATGVQASGFDGIFNSLLGAGNKAEVKAEVPKAPTEADMVNKALEGDMEYQKALWAAQARAKAQMDVAAATAKAAADAKVAEVAKKPEAAPATTDVAKLATSVGGDAIKKAAQGALANALGDSEVGKTVAGVAQKALSGGGIGSLFGF